MKIWLIKLVIIVAVVAGGVLMTMELGVLWYKEVSPYERCVALKDDYARLVERLIKHPARNSDKQCSEYSPPEYAYCVKVHMRNSCKSLTHW